MPRQRKFEPNQVLDKAMHLFWRQGYTNTSLHELEEAMGINRFSIYATFESKHALFLAALERYRETVVARLIAGMEEPDAGIETIHRFFTQFVDLAQGEAGNWGCFLCNSATELALDDRDVAQEVEKYKARILRAFRHALTNAQQRGELPASTDRHEWELYLLGALFGLMVYTKMNTPPAALERYIRTVLAHLS